jgi:hypothetical protein
MTAYGSECFTMNEVNRLKILQDVIDGRLTTSLASQRLGLTDRHCRRLLARYRESGPLALANRRRGLRGNRQLVPGLAELALGFIRDNYADFGSHTLVVSPAFISRACGGIAWASLSRTTAHTMTGSKAARKNAAFWFILMMRPAV